MGVRAPWEGPWCGLVVGEHSPVVGKVLQVDDDELKMNWWVGDFGDVDDDDDMDDDGSSDDNSR